MASWPAQTLPANRCPDVGVTLTSMFKSLSDEVGCPFGNPLFVHSGVDRIRSTPADCSSAGLASYRRCARQPGLSRFDQQKWTSIPAVRSTASVEGTLLRGTLGTNHGRECRMSAAPRTPECNCAGLSAKQPCADASSRQTSSCKFESRNWEANHQLVCRHGPSACRERLFGQGSSDLLPVGTFCYFKAREIM